jgi:hypothetical protein
MDDYLNVIIPKVYSYGEDLREKEFYMGKPWLEVRDSEHFHHVIVHFFNEGGEYLRSVDGNVSVGQWRHLTPANKFLISGRSSEPELFDLAFLDGEFFILRKHGGQYGRGESRYFFMIHEAVGKRLEWRDAIEKLYKKTQNFTSMYTILAIIILLIIAIVIVLS